MPRLKKNGRGLAVGVVGASGMVGRELLSVLEKSRFPVGELKVFSSGRGAKSVLFRSRRLPLSAPSLAALRGCRLAFFVSSDAVSRRWAPALAASGVWVIDDSSAFRLDANVPLVIPEINASVLRRDRRLVAGPNCTMSGLGLAAAALDRAAGLKDVRAASYQAVSGAGLSALREFLLQARTVTGRLRAERADLFAPALRSLRPAVLPRAIAFNAVPQVGDFAADGYSREEIKVAAELRKVLRSPRLPVSVTAVRVPTLRGHALAAWLRLKRPLSLARARAVLKKAAGVVMMAAPDYPTPAGCAGRTEAFVGRLRRGASPNEIALWVVSDNLLKGAASNSLQIAQELLRRGWL
ncbi:MAG: aspartate-semialdehyde dehydrogenase [Elusimicrobia bacterium]|nr:aspartate-semialdehyde dehydrogenase [Elusimicrobiota bacterium]MDE2313836.1 aspartate-semialdehyde dehydrogenase [Elusimicrobiota bacterium]